MKKFLIGLVWTAYIGCTAFIAITTHGNFWATLFVYVVGGGITIRMTERISDAYPVYSYWQTTEVTEELLKEAIKEGNDWIAREAKERGITVEEFLKEQEDEGPRFLRYFKEEAERRGVTRYELLQEYLARIRDSKVPTPECIDLEELHKKGHAFTSEEMAHINECKEWCAKWYAVANRQPS